ncbi:MAG: hypothetical protein WCK86_23150 [Planctomycetia bacterium]|jgi:hypothetical protein
MADAGHSQLLKLLSGTDTPTESDFRRLVETIDSHSVLAKVFILEGVPFVFRTSPMKYMIFREQVAERFEVGSQDVCIVGSAKLGFSPSPTEKYGRPFAETSDVDVVIISDSLFHHGSRELFRELNYATQETYHDDTIDQSADGSVEIGRAIKDALRNYVYQNFNPGLLSDGHPLQLEIFGKISGTSGLFLALEPQVFVSKIRCRIFRNWRAAEEYYANSLRQLQKYFRRQNRQSQARTEKKRTEQSVGHEASDNAVSNG